jgi:hypothetical protein
MSRPYAYQLIDSSKVVSAMADIPAEVPRPTAGGRDSSGITGQGPTESAMPAAIRSATG